MSKTRLSIACVALIAFLGIAAWPAGRVSAGTPHADRITLTMYVHSQYGIEGENYYKDVVVKPFEQHYPDISVNVVFMTAPRDVVNQQLAAGDGPDIIVTDGTADVANYASAHDVIPLTRYAAQYGWNTRFAPWTYPLLKYQGTLYALPDKADTMLIFYNKDMFKKNGWTIPRSYADLVALCKKIQAKGIIPFALGTADVPNASEWYLTMAVNATLGLANERKLFEGLIPWNGSLMQKAIGTLTSLWAAGYINDKQSSAVKVNDMQTEFNNGQAAMDLGGTWILPALMTTRPPFDWSFYEMPGWSSGVGTITPVGVGQTYLINVHSRRPDAAALFLNWREQPAVLMQGINAIGLPPLRVLNLHLVHGLDIHWQEAVAQFNSAVTHDTAGYVSWTYWPPSTRAYALSNIDALWHGQLSLKTFTDQLQATYLKDKQAGVYHFSS